MQFKDYFACVLLLSLLMGCDLSEKESRPTVIERSVDNSNNSSEGISGSQLPKVSINSSIQSSVFIDLDKGKQVEQSNADWDIVFENGVLKQRSSSNQQLRAADTGKFNFDDSIDLRQLSFVKQTDDVQYAIDATKIIDPQRATIGQNNAWLFWTDGGQRIAYMNIVTARATQRTINVYLRQYDIATDTFTAREDAELPFYTVGTNKVGLYFDADAYFNLPIDGADSKGAIKRTITSSVVSDKKMQGWDFHFEADVDFSASSATVNGTATSDINGGASGEGVSAAIFLNPQDTDIAVKSKPDYSNGKEPMTALWGFDGLQTFYTQERYRKLAWGTDGYNIFSKKLWYDVKAVNNSLKAVANGRVYVVESGEGKAYKFQIDSHSDTSISFNIEGMSFNSGSSSGFDQNAYKIKMADIAFSDNQVLENVVGKTPKIKFLDETSSEANAEDTANIKLTLEGDDASSFEIVDGQLSLKAQDYEAPADANKDNQYTVVVVASNEISQDKKVVSVRVINQNETSHFDMADVGQSTQENTIWQLDLSSLKPSSGQNNGALSFELNTGADASLFNLYNNTLVLGEKDYEAPTDEDKNNVYEVNITAKDEDNNRNVFKLSVSVTNQIEKNNFTLMGIQTNTVTELSYDSGREVVAQVGMGVRLGQLTYTLSGDDKDYFYLDSAQAKVFLKPTDYETLIKSKGRAQLTATIIATDTDNNTAQTTYAVTVVDENEYPTITLSTINSENVNENTPYSQTLTVSPEQYNKKSVCPNDDIKVCTDNVTLAYQFNLTGQDSQQFSLKKQQSNRVAISMSEKDFETPSDADANNVYDVGVSVTVNGLTQPIVTSWQVKVIDVAETASFTSPAKSETVNENEVVVLSDIVTQGDSPIGQISYAIEQKLDSAFFEVVNHTQVRFKGADFENPQDSNQDNVYKVSIKLSDSQGNFAIHQHTITVKDVKENASFNLNIAQSEKTADENQVVVWAVPSFSGDTPIGAVSFSFELGASPDFSVNKSGVVSLQAQDFEALTNKTLSAVLVATDSDGNKASITLKATITDVVESNAFSVNKIADYALAENQTDTPHQITVDTNGANLDLVYELVGNDASQFNLNQTNHTIHLNTQNYEAPKDVDKNNIYEVSIKVYEKGKPNLPQISNLSVTVTDVKETVNLVMDDINLSHPENSDFSKQITLASSSGTAIGALNYTLSGVDAGLFGITGDGLLSLSARDFESPTDSNSDNVYTIQVQVEDDDQNTTSAQVNVSVTNVQETRTLRLSGIADYAIDEVTQDSAHTPVLTGNAVGILVYSIDAGTHTDKFVFNTQTGAVQLKPQDYETLTGQSNPAVTAQADFSIPVTIRVTDQDNNTASTRFTVSVRDVVEYSGFSVSDITDSVDENQAKNLTIPVSVSSYNEKYPCGVDLLTVCNRVKTIHYSLSITSNTANAFTVKSVAGASDVLVFNKQDYETPVGVNNSNTYQAVISVSDGITPAKSSKVSVTVNNVAESANFTISNIEYQVNEHSEDAGLNLPTPSGDQPIGSIGDKHYAITGDDARAFEINNGKVKLVEEKDFENPSDTNTDNVYQATLTLTDDDNNSASSSIKVTVLNTKQDKLTFTARSKKWVNLLTHKVSDSQPADDAWHLVVDRGFINVSQNKVKSSEIKTSNTTNDFASITGKLWYDWEYKDTKTPLKNDVTAWNANCYSWYGNTQHCDKSVINKPFGSDFYGEKPVVSGSGLTDGIYAGIGILTFRINNRSIILRTTQGRYVKIIAKNIMDNDEGSFRTNNFYFTYAVQLPGETQFGSPKEFCLSFRAGNYPLNGNGDYNDGDQYYKQAFIDFDHIASINNTPPTQGSGVNGAFPVGCRTGDYSDVPSLKDLFYTVTETPDYDRRTYNMRQSLSAGEDLGKTNWDLALAINFDGLHSYMSVNGNRTQGYAAMAYMQEDVDGISGTDYLKLSGEGASYISAFDHLMPADSLGVFKSNQRVYQIRVNPDNENKHLKLQVEEYDSNLQKYTIKFEQFD